MQEFGLDWLPNFLSCLKLVHKDPGLILVLWGTLPYWGTAILVVVGPSTLWGTQGTRMNMYNNCISCSCKDNHLQVMPLYSSSRT